jgi:uncharacterized protein (TIRG00374 family)
MDLLRRAVGSVWVRALVTAALLALVALQINWDEAGTILADGSWGWAALACAVLFVALVVGGVRWHLFLLAAGLHTPPRETARAYAIGVFSNNFLPTGFGGDAARAWIVGRSRAAVVKALTSVAADRVTGLACLVLVAWVAVAFDPDSVPGELVAGLLATTVAGIAGFGLLLVALKGGPRLAGRLPARLRTWARDARDTLVAYLRNPALVAAAFVLGVAFQALVVTATWMLGKAIEMDLPFALAAVAVPLVLVITLIPLSIAGFGLREGGYVVLLGEAGVPATDATLLSLLTVASLAVTSVPGAVAMILPGRKPPQHLDEALAEEAERPRAYPSPP